MPLQGAGETFARAGEKGPPVSQTEDPCQTPNAQRLYLRHPSLQNCESCISAAQGPPASWYFILAATMHDARPLLLRWSLV